MGTNNLTTYSDGDVISSSTVNQYKTALNQNFVPRNSSGVPTNNGGTMGESGTQWLKAFIAGGFWSIGDIKPHHSFNGTADPGQGWMLCDGSQITEANYEAQSWASAGDWNTYVVSSALENLYTPDLTGRYLVGVATTTQTGSTTITEVGNSSHQIDINHSHSHNHQWYNNNNAANDNGYDSGGSSADVTKTAKSSGNFLNVLDGSTAAGLNDLYTDNDATTALSATQSIQPESIEVQYYIRII